MVPGPQRALATRAPIGNGFAAARRRRPAVVVARAARAGVVLAEVGQQERAPAPGVFGVAAHHLQPGALDLALASRPSRRRGERAGELIAPVQRARPSAPRRPRRRRPGGRGRASPSASRARSVGQRVAARRAAGVGEPLGNRRHVVADTPRAVRYRAAPMSRPVKEPRIGGVRRPVPRGRAPGSRRRGRRAPGVEHPPHVGLVDPHPERDRGRRRSGPTPRGTRSIARRRAARGQARRGTGHVVPGRRQSVPHRMGAGVGRGVHDPGSLELVRGPFDLPLLCLRGGRRGAPTERSPGRSKSPITTSGSRSPRRRPISSRTGGAAVAVSAIRTRRRARRPARRGASSPGGSRAPTG